MGTKPERSDVRIVKGTDSGPQPIDDQSLERVAGGETHYTVTFPGGCTHEITHPSDTITEGELFDMALADHNAMCT